MTEQAMVRSLMAERIKVLAYIHSLVRNADVAEDVFQDVCVLAVQKRAEIEDVAHLLNWMRTTARFLSLNVLRSRNERHLTLGNEALELLEPEWARADVDDNAAISEALRRCLGQLSPQMQELVRQRYVERVDYPTLAERTKRSVKSLYVTFSRIYAALGYCIERNTDGAERTHG